MALGPVTLNPGAGGAKIAVDVDQPIAGTDTPVSELVVDAQIVSTTGGVNLPVAVKSSVLPTGAATQTTLAAVKADLDALVADSPPLGQAAMAGSVPVAIASDQTTLPVSPSAAPIRFDTRYDFAFAAGFLYIGYAALGTASSATAWTVRRFTLTAGLPTLSQWTAVNGTSWDNHAAASYT